MGGVVWVIDVGGRADDSGMRDLHALRSDPLPPHHATIGGEVRADCGHSTGRTCDGRTACADCEGCYAARPRTNRHICWRRQDGYQPTGRRRAGSLRLARRTRDRPRRPHGPRGAARAPGGGGRGPGVVVPHLPLTTPCQRPICAYCKRYRALRWSRVRLRRFGGGSRRSLRVRFRCSRGRGHPSARSSR